MRGVSTVFSQPCFVRSAFVHIYINYLASENSRELDGTLRAVCAPFFALAPKFASRPNHVLILRFLDDADGMPAVGRVVGLRFLDDADARRRSGCR